MLSDAEIARIISGENPVKVYRENRRLTKRMLARKASITVEQLERIEKGRVAGDRLRVIADILRVDVCDLKPFAESFGDCAVKVGSLPSDD